MSSVKQYMKFVKPYKWKIVATILIGIIKFGIPLLMPLILKYVIDNIINAEGLSSPEKTTNLLWLMGISFVVFLVLRPPVEYIRQYLAQWVGNKILYDIRDRLFDHLQKLSLKYYSKTKTGEIISRVIHDVEQTKTFVMTGLMNVWLDLVTILIAIGIMMTMDVGLTLVAIILFPFYGFSIKYFYGKLRSLPVKDHRLLPRYKDICMNASKVYRLPEALHWRITSRSNSVTEMRTSWIKH